MNFVGTNKQTNILEEFIKLIDKIDEMEIVEEKIYENIPDDYMDPICNVILENPVILPSSKKIMDYDVIRKHLLYYNFDPFNRHELSLEDLENFNEIDYNKKKMEQLKIEINNWKKEQDK